MKKKIIFVVLLCIPLVCFSRPLPKKHQQAERRQEHSYGNVVVERVNSIYDADTFRVDIDGWPAIVGKNIPIRANGFDAPEIRGKCATEKEKANLARQITVNALEKGERIELRNVRRGKYFRLIADVYIDGHALSETQISSGLSRPYHGGKRGGWCKRKKNG